MVLVSTVYFYHVWANGFSFQLIGGSEREANVLSKFNTGNMKIYQFLLNSLENDQLLLFVGLKMPLSISFLGFNPKLLSMMKLMIEYRFKSIKNSKMLDVLFYDSHFSIESSSQQGVRYSGVNLYQLLSLGAWVSLDGFLKALDCNLLINT